MGLYGSPDLQEPTNVRPEIHYDRAVTSPLPLGNG